MGNVTLFLDFGVVLMYLPGPDIHTTFNRFGLISSAQFRLLSSSMSFFFLQSSQQTSSSIYMAGSITLTVHLSEWITSRLPHILSLSE
jgi:hypothetical protein